MGNTAIHRSCERGVSAGRRDRVGRPRPRALVVVAIVAMTIAIAAPVFSLTPAPNYRTVPAPRRGIDTLPVGWVPPRAAQTLRNLQYGIADRQLLDLYLPDAGKFPGARPIIIWLHSGGWVGGSRIYTADVIQRQIARGFAVASVDYALAPSYRFPVPLQDVKVAIRWAKASATQYQFDPSKVILTGGSAGGHVAALVGVTPGRFEPTRTRIPVALRMYDDTVAAVVDFAGPTDIYAFNREPGTGATGAMARRFGAALLGCANPRGTAPLRCPAGIERSASVAPYLSRHSPPVFMAYGAQDTLVPARRHAVPLARAWAALKGWRAVWVEVIANTGHNVSADTLNNTYLDRFLAGVVDGSIH